MQINQKQLLLLFGALVVLVLSITIYQNRSNAYAYSNPVNGNFEIRNPEGLQRWLPAESYSYTVDRLRDYIATTNADAPVTAMLITKSVNTGSDGYSFTVEYLPIGVSHEVTVRVLNYDGTISTAVYIDGAVQDISVSKETSDTSYSGITTLIDQGLSAPQGEALKLAFLKFKPNLSNASINESTIQMGPLNPNSADGSTTYFFTVLLDGKSYKATVKTDGLTGLTLTLKDSSGKAVYSSGVVRYGQ